MKNRLKELRQLHQWSQSELARKLGVSRQAINGFESGKFDPTLDMAFKIACLFNVALEDVFIYEVKNSMQTLIERFKQYFGLERFFGFERFTEQALNALKFAQNQAVLEQKSQVEPEHLLAGLLADSTTASACLLRANGVVLNIETNEHSFESYGTSKLSLESKFVLELALQIVRLQGKKSIETEHLLWGLLQLPQTPNTTIANVFQRYNIHLATLNNQLAQIV